MPLNTLGDASATYTVDGGADVPFLVENNFMQSAQCETRKILVQITGLEAGTHSLEVVYNGDDNTAPLSLCALAATPLDLTGLDTIQSASQAPPKSSPSSNQPQITDHIPASHWMHISIALGTVAFLVIVGGLVYWARKKCTIRSKGPEQLIPVAAVIPFVSRSPSKCSSYTSPTKGHFTRIMSRPPSATSISQVLDTNRAATDIQSSGDVHETARAGLDRRNSSTAEVTSESRPPSYYTNTTAV